MSPNQHLTQISSVYTTFIHLRAILWHGSPSPFTKKGFQKGIHIGENSPIDHLGYVMFRGNQSSPLDKSPKHSHSIGPWMCKRMWHGFGHHIRMSKYDNDGPWHVIEDYCRNNFNTYSLHVIWMLANSKLVLVYFNWLLLVIELKNPNLIVHLYFIFWNWPLVRVNLAIDHGVDCVGLPQSKMSTLVIWLFGRK